MILEGTSREADRKRSGFVRVLEIALRSNVVLISLKAEFASDVKRRSGSESEVSLTNLAKGGFSYDKSVPPYENQPTQPQV